VLLLVPAAFLLWAVWFVVRQVYYRKVIAFERFDRQSRVEAATGLRTALRRRRGQSCCAFLAALSVAWADFSQAAWTLGEWKGNPRFLGMFGALFGDYDDTHAAYIGLELARNLGLAPISPHISPIPPLYLPLYLPSASPTSPLARKLGLALFLATPPSWGALQLYGVSSLQARGRARARLRSCSSTASPRCRWRAGGGRPHQADASPRLMFPVYPPPRWWAPSPCSCAGATHPRTQG
jgi:hypothetical protein